MEWLGTIVDQIVMIGEQNKTFHVFAEYNAMLHVKELMHTMLAVIERHIAFLDPALLEDNRKAAGGPVACRFAGHFLAMLTPPVRECAVLEMVTFSYKPSSLVRNE